MMFSFRGVDRRLVERVIYTRVPAAKSAKGEACLWIP